MSKFNKPLAFVAAAALAAGFAVSPVALAQGSNPHNPNKWQAQKNRHHNAVTSQAVQKTIARFKKEQPQAMQRYFDGAYGYAVFPSVGKGGLVIGGAYGGGEVFKHGDLVGNATITKFDIGAQIGGETFSEIIFFQNAKAFNHFTQGNYQFSANATAVGIKSGNIANNDYSNGVAVFTMAKAGLMGGVSIGGQKFSFTPLSKVSGK